MFVNKIKQKFIGGSSRSLTVKKNILGSLFIKGISILTSLFLVPITLGYVSAEIYGVWLTISSILHWLTYMDVGFTLGLKNRLAECLAKEDYEKGRSLVSTTYFIMTVIFVPFAIIMMFVIPYINWCGVLNVSDIHQTVITRTIQVLLVFISIQMIVNVFVAVVAAYQKTALSSLFSVIGQICSLIIIGLMTHFVEPSLFNLAFAYSLMPIIIVAISSIIYFKTSMKDVVPSFRTINLKYVKDLWNLGAKFFLIQVQMIVLYQSTNILISHLAGPESVTQYNIAYKIFNVVAMLCTIVLTPLWPAFTDAYTKKDYAWMKSVYYKMTRIFMLVFLAIAAIVACSPFIYDLWIGDKVHVPFTLTVSIAIYTAIHCWDSLQVMLINGVGTVKLQTYVTMIGLILHIPLSLILGKYIGIYGVVASMCLINVIYVSFFTIQIRKIIGQKAKGIWLK